MIKIISVDIKEFRKIIYPEYKKIFPRLERKSYSILKKNFNDDIFKIYNKMFKEKWVNKNYKVIQ